MRAYGLFKFAFLSSSFVNHGMENRLKICDAVINGN